MAHDLVFQLELEAGVVFVCTKCPASINFVLPAYGNPNPVASGGSWIPPENPDQYMSPCTGE